MVEFTWKTADNENMEVPISNLTESSIILDKVAKDFKFDIENFVDSSICEFADFHHQKEDKGSDLKTNGVYRYSKEDCLVSTLRKEAAKKSDLGHDLYICRLKDNKDQTEKLIPCNELSSSIVVTITELGKEQGNKVFKVNVSIQDKLLEQLQPIL